jgi:hypothetical protein
MPMFIARTGAAAAPALLLLLAASDAPLAAGLWETRNVPGVATLDGTKLEDLPIGPIKTAQICLSAAEASDPARFFARDMVGCTIGSASASRGRLTVEGTCPNQVEGPDGSFELNGKYDGGSYEVDFATSSLGENGLMTFSGKMTGRRIGACTAP